MSETTPPAPELDPVLVMLAAAAVGAGVNAYRTRTLSGTAVGAAVGAGAAYAYFNFIAPSGSGAEVKAVGGKDCSSISIPPGRGSWKGRLGERTGGGINFHLMHDGRNNYRAGIKQPRKGKKGEVDPTPDFFRELKCVYGIERVITLNGEAKPVLPMIKEAGLESHYFPMGENSMADREEFEQIKQLLLKGNNLLHCTHGADRTGAIAGRYYHEVLGWPLEKAVADTDKYGGHKYRGCIDFLEKGPKK